VLYFSDSTCEDADCFPTVYGYYVSKTCLGLYAFFILLMTNLLIAQFKYVHLYFVYRENLEINRNTGIK
jgi:hypothetical protein